MQFRAARSRWTMLRLLRYSIPREMSSRKRSRGCRDTSWGTEGHEGQVLGGHAGTGPGGT